MTVDRNFIQIQSDYQRFIKEYVQVEFEYKRLEKQYKAMKEQIVALFSGKDGVLVNEGGEVVADFVITKQVRFDPVSFKETSPDLYDLYQKEIEYKTLRINKVL